MSLCLGITKTIAISSLGLYAGVLSASTILSLNKHTSIILSNLDIINKAQIKQIINKIFQFGNVIGGLSTAFFGLSYFGAPIHWKHPYLLYGMLIAPISNLYLYYLKGSIENELRVQSIGNKKDLTSTDPKPIQITEDNDSNTSPTSSTNESIVDLGQNGSQSPFAESNAEVLESTRSFCNSIGTRLLLTTAISVVGLVQSVIGVYGEGNFI